MFTLNSGNAQRTGVVSAPREGAGREDRPAIALEVSTVGDARRVSRRSLFKRTSALALGAAAAGSAELAAGSEDGGPPTASSLGTVEAVHADGSLRVRSQAGSRTIEGDGGQGSLEQFAPAAVADGSSFDVRPGGSQSWAVNDEAVVIETFDGSRWTLSEVQRLYRPISSSRVEDRNGDRLETTNGGVQLTGDTAARSSADGFEAIPISELDEGDVVGGIGYLSTESEDCWLTAVQAGGYRGRGTARR